MNINSNIPTEFPSYIKALIVAKNPYLINGLRDSVSKLPIKINTCLYDDNEALTESLKNSSPNILILAIENPSKAIVKAKRLCPNITILSAYSDEKCSYPIANKFDISDSKDLAQKLSEFINCIIDLDLLINKDLNSIARYSNANLTQAEKNVLYLLSYGLSTKEVSLKLGIQDGTVRTRVSKLLSKLGCESRAELVAFSFRSGFVTEQEDLIKRKGD